MSYRPDPDRYDGRMPYRRCGRSGLRLPAIALGLWHNFGAVDPLATARAMLHRAFDLGITHFDLANNYGPPPGSAESTFGAILADDLRPYRDELIVSNKAGYRMWPGPYGDHGSRKYLVASCDASLRRTGLDYFDIFYHHRSDPDTPLEETMQALDFIVRSGRALYAGISSYDPQRTRAAAALLRDLGTPCLIHQPVYNMLNRGLEDGLLDALDDTGIGAIVFSPLAQGVLSNKYLHDIPADSRAAKAHGFLRAEAITPELRERLQRLDAIASARGCSLAQLAVLWVLRHPQICSALVGASKVAQIEELAAIGRHDPLTETELAAVATALAD